MKTTQSKTTKPIPASATEECGVWLDAGELRKRSAKLSPNSCRPMAQLKYTQAAQLLIDKGQKMLYIVFYVSVITFMQRDLHKLELCEQNHHYIRWAPVKTMDKENSRSTSPLQHVKHLPLKQQFSPSPAKLFSDFKVKYCRSPKKSVKESLGDEGDSLAMLFTQDSEGFRVIANRSKWVRCPLKDCTNSTEGIDYSDIPKPMEREENTDLEPEMLFTKDSQGNMVIKH
uniref:Uncharacterized protein n=1 Tax=Electrophorus electricus TaxID=8005 RepID=A0A4W4GAB0_ELEEL